MIRYLRHFVWRWRVERKHGPRAFRRALSITAREMRG